MHGLLQEIKFRYEISESSNRIERSNHVSSNNQSVVKYEHGGSIDAEILDTVMGKLQSVEEEFTLQMGKYEQPMNLGKN
jgi:hypothetical protein